MQRVLLLSAWAATVALAGTFTTSAVTFYSSESCSGGSNSINNLDSCKQLPNHNGAYASLTCSSSTRYTLRVCPSETCSSSFCVSVEGDTNCIGVPSLFGEQLGSVKVDCGVLTPLSIGLIATAAVILLACVCLCFCSCMCDTLRGCYERGAALEEAESLLAASNAKASQLRLASALARVDAQALKNDVARLEAELLATRVAQARARGTPRFLVAPMGAAAAEGAAVEGEEPVDATSHRPLPQWKNPRGGQ